MQPLDTDELLDILEFGVPASWRKEFTMLESCEPSKDGPKVEKTKRTKTRGRKRKAKVLTMPTTTTPGVEFYCKMHRPNRTHNMKDCLS
eukprot:11985911-Ditylum_brightwellii.AAC.1